ncbi:MAG: prepilin peptidase [Erysipelotrichaceae bacterium]|nr:prepilin peptidase [Erysipelotrichaceae bacterium]
MFYFMIIIIGMCLASFVNVVVYRFPKEEGFILGHSYCPKCHHELSFFDMIPVVSFVVLKGHCRYCHGSIGIRDTIIEILGGFIAFICYKVFDLSIMFVIAYILSLVFITISLIDIDTMIVDDRFQLILAVIAIISTFFIDISFIDRVVGCVALVLPFYLLNMYKECIGGADLKLMAIMGWMLGFCNALIGLYISIITASLYSLGMLLQQKVTTKNLIPFIPFLCIGFFVSLLFHQVLLSIYFYFL